MAQFQGIAERHVLVTGASQGIGRGIAVAFARAGARVSAIARRERELASLIDELGGSGKHGYVAADLTLPEAAERALAPLTDRAGPPEIVVHAVGGGLGQYDLGAPVEEWQRIWYFNVGQAIAINNIVLPRMADRRWGRIVHLSSRVAVEYGGAGPYAAAKAYLNAYITVMGRAYAERNVLVNGIMPSAIIAPGNAWSRAQADKPEMVRSFLAEHQSINRLGTPEDLIPFILLLASDDNRFAAGTILSLDGGSK